MQLIIYKVRNHWVLEELQKLVSLKLIINSLKLLLLSRAVVVDELIHCGLIKQVIRRNILIKFKKLLLHHHHLIMSTNYLIRGKRI